MTPAEIGRLVDEATRIAHEQGSRLLERYPDPLELRRFLVRQAMRTPQPDASR